MVRQKFKKLLTQLNSEETMSDGKKASVLMRKIRMCITNTANIPVLDLLTTLIFDKTIGLLYYMGKAQDSSTHNEGVNEAFRLIEYLAVNFEASIAPHAALVITFSTSLVTRDKVNFNLKKTALDLMQRLLSSTVFNINVNDVARKLEIYALKSGKDTPTVLSELYQFLGFLCEKFPESVVETHKGIFIHVLKTLKHQNVLKNKSQTLQYGCLCFIDGYLCNHQSEQADRVFELIWSSCQFPGDEKKRVLNRAALKIIERHCSKFINRLYPQVQEALPEFMRWATSANKDDQKSGYNVLLSFYVAMSDHLLDKNLPDGEKVFNQCVYYLLQRVKNNDEFKIYEFRSSLIGISEFAKCGEMYNKSDSLSDVCGMIIQKAEGIRPNSNSYLLYHAYIECISKFISYLPLMPEQLNCLQRLTVSLIESYPNVEGPFKIYNVRSLEKSFYSINSIGSDVFNNYLHQVIYQSLIRCCSHPMHMDIDIQKEFGKTASQVSYKSYVPLWEHLLNLKNSEVKVAISIKKSTSRDVVDTFFKSMIAIIKKLNLNLVETYPDLSDPEVAYSALKSKDFQVLINLVDLFQDVAHFIDEEYFSNWIAHLLNEMILMAHRQPLVSAFNKIISKVFECSADFFHHLDIKTSSCLKQIQDYIRTKLSRLNLLKGDLQISVLQVILLAPVQIIEEFLPLLPQVFDVTFRVGSGYLLIVEQAVDALDRWSRSMDRNKLDPLFKHVLPHFDMILQSHKTHTDISYEEDPDTKSNLIMVRGKFIKRSLETDTHLYNVQKKIVLLLGKLDQSVSKYILEQKLPNVKLSYHLPYNIPLGDMKPKLNLEVFIPRVCELALSSSDRKTKIPAGELVHTLTTVCLGSLVQANEKEVEEITNVFRSLAETCLKLACDTDVVFIQLFRELTRQMCHYFSSKQQMSGDKKVVEVFIQVLMEGLTNDCDTGLRDYSALCIRELLEWFIRQHSADERKILKFTKTILRFVFSFSLNPCYTTRLGASVAFNNLYSLLRDKKYILDVYWVEIYYYFMCNLKLHDQSEDTTHVVNAIYHTVRPFTEMSYIFNDDLTKRRRKPPEFENALLKDVVSWTLQQCSASNRQLRKVSMEFVEKTSSKVTGYSSLKEFLTSTTTFQITYDLSCKPKSLEDTVNWLTHFNILLDNLIWLVEKDALETQVSIQFFQSVDIYLEIGDQQLTSDNLELITKCQAMKETAKSELIRAIHCLAKQTQVKSDIICLFGKKSFWKFIHDSIVSESDELLIFLKTFTQFFDGSLLKQLFQLVGETCKEFKELLLNRLSKIVRFNRIEETEQNRLKIAAFIDKCELWPSFIKNSELNLSGNEIVQYFVKALFVTRGKKQMTIYFNPATLTYLTDVLSFAFSIGVDPEILAKHTQNTDIVVRDETLEEIELGRYFVDQFQDVIFKFLLNKPLDVFFSSVDERSLSMISKLSDHISRIEFSEEVRSNFASYILEHCKDIAENSKRVAFISLLKNTLALSSNQKVLQEKSIIKWLVGDSICFFSEKELVKLFEVLRYLSAVEEIDNPTLSEMLVDIFRIKKLFFDNSDRATLASVYEHTLIAFESTGSLVILNFFLRICTTRPDILSDQILEHSLTQLVKTVSASHLMKIFDALYDAFSKPSSDGKTRLFIVRRLIVPLLHTCGKVNVTTFFASYLLTLVGIIKADANRFSLAQKEADICAKIASAELLQTLYSICTNVEVAELADDANKQIVSVLNDLKVNSDGRPEIVELNRQLICSKYLALSTIISNSPIKPIKKDVPYQVFLFRVDDKAIWHRIIDNNKQYTLSMLVSNSYERKKILTSIRKSRDNTESTNIKYITTQTLFDSTLIEDVTKFDFMFSRVQEGAVLDSSMIEMEMEVDEWNKHECMPVICSVIKHMVENGITPLPTSGEYEVPVWLASIMKGLETGTINTKLFLMKLLINVETYVIPYAAKILPLLIDVCIEVFVKEKLNHIFTDILILMIKSNRVYIPDPDRATRIMLMVIKKLPHVRSYVVKNNLTILKTLIEVWKMNLVESEIIKAVNTEEMEVDGCEEKLPLNLKMELYGILLANDIPAWMPGEQDSYLKKIIHHFSNADSKDQPAVGEVCGMILNTLRDEPNSEDYKSLVNRKLFDRKTGDDLEARRLYAVFKHYPEISSLNVFFLVNTVWTKKGKVIEQCLEMLLSHIERNEQLPEDYLMLSIEQLIKDFVVSDQITVQDFIFRIVFALIGKIKDDKLVKIVKEVLPYSHHKHLSCRKTIYSICSKMFHVSQRMESTEALTNECKSVLLEGLMDDNLSLREMCHSFWLSSDMPERTCERISFVLRDLYTPGTEASFLCCLATYLFDLSKSSPDFNLRMYEYALTDSEFRNLNIRSLWRNPNASIAPMFAESLANQMSRPYSLTSTQMDVDIQVQATAQSFLFAPTALEEPVEVEEETSFVISSSLATPMPDDNFKIPDYNYLRKKVRVGYGSGNNRAYFAKKATAKKDVAIERAKDRRMKVEAGVNPLRPYRTGDFPDIQICHSDLIKPLEILVQRDPILCKQLLVTLFTTISQELKGNEKTVFKENCKNTLSAIVKSSNVKDTSVLSFIFRISLEYEDCLKLDDIKEVVKHRDLNVTGALLVEKLIQNDDTSSESKRAKGTLDDSSKTWLCLATCYKGLGEEDVFRGILMDKVEVPEKAIWGVRCDSYNDWNSASKYYTDVLNSEHLPTELNEFFSNPYFSCLSKLSDWDEINRTIRYIADDLDIMWTSSHRVETMLRWFLRSEFMKSVYTNPEAYQTLMAKWLKDENKATLLFDQFKEDSAFHFLSDNKIQQSRYYMYELVIKYLTSWANLNSFSKVREDKVKNLTIVSELNDILSVLSEYRISERDDLIDSIQKDWNLKVPSVKSDLEVWDLKITLRKLLIDKLKSSDFDTTNLSRALVTAELTLIKTALKQNNFKLARKYYESINHDQLDDDLKLEKNVCYCLLLLNSAEHADDPNDVVLKSSQAAVKFVALTETLTNSVSDHLIRIHLNEAVSRMYHNLHSLLETDKVSVNSIRSNFSLSESTKEEVLAFLMGKRFVLLQDTVSNTYYKDDYSNHCNEISNAHLSLAKCCKELEGRETLLVKHLLTSMKLGNAKAKQLFCYLLQTSVLKTDEIRNEFQHGVVSVPVWMFIAWINQILSLLCSELFPCLKDIILRLVKEYPNAVLYNFRLSKQSYVYDETERGQQLKGFANQLSSLLEDDLTNTFLNSLRHVTSPEVVLYDFIGKIIMECKMKCPDPERLSSLRHEAMEILYSDNRDRGIEFKNIEKFKEALTSSDVNKIYAIAQNVVKQKQSRNLSPWLKSYNTWLSNYQCLDSRTIEIPGQYDGDKKPLPQYHVTIFSFKPELLVLKSKCKPIRLSFIGNNAREYKFMIKFGDDLRQDQRLMQVFRYMNHQLAEEQSNLAIDTYGVIPLSCSLGLIQWVDNTLALLQTVSVSLEADRLNITRDRYYRSLGKGGTQAEVYINTYTRVKQEQIVTLYNRTVRSFPEDLLRKSFWNLSQSPEHFMFLRRNFATSLGVVNVAHWLLGIGDRHLQNTLLSSTTGRVLGIDFGMSFGFAVQCLNPPELIPFRLTPQIVNFLQPLGTSGWIKESMIHTLRCFRRDPSVLLSMLQVFVQEPSLDWQLQARRQAEKIEEVSNDVQWYPKQKISLVEGKLKGASPCVSVISHLKSGQHQAAYLEQLIAVLMGNRPRQEQDLSVEDQVDWLISLATDDHVLSKTWVGWDPWL